MDNRSVKIIDFSGSEGATKNMTVYECGDDIMIVDCGIGFPDDQMPGIDVIIPDFSYLLQNKEKIRGLLVTHAHEDHLGAIPYLLRDLNIPIYANKLVQAFIKERLVDKGSEQMLKDTSFHLIEDDGKEFNLGSSFTVSGFRVNHSVPTTMGYSINTPQGRILHIADFKIDWSPVLDKPIDIATISGYGAEGVLCLLSDCLGANTEGYSKSEQTMKHIFNDLYAQGEGRQVMLTTISSNISRMYQMIDAAVKEGRKVVLGGRSIQKSVEIARELGFLPFDNDVFVDHKKSGGYDQSELVYIVAGAFGQQGSTLDRIARGEHDTIYLEENSMVVFSADPSPPGTRIPVERLMDQLTLRGAEVIYSKIQENLHISGHGPRGDLTMMASIVNPKYFIPIGGSVTQMRAYREMVVDLGYDRESVFELLEGQSVIFQNGNAGMGPTIQTKPVYIDGGEIGNIGPVVIKDREILSDEGVFVVVVPIDKESKTILGSVDVITRGFIYVKESKELMGRSKDMINKVLDKQAGEVTNWQGLQTKIEKEVERFLLKETGRSPMVIVHAINV